jgi:malate dehydrogenase
MPQRLRLANGKQASTWFDTIPAQIGKVPGMHRQRSLRTRKGIPMSVRIAILGASGAVGGTLAVHILRSGLLEPQDCLMLVGHGAHSIERRLMPVRVDLLDAFDDERVQISIVPDIDEFEADIVVVAAGETKSSENATRRDLAVVNLPIFRQIAQECAARLPRALFIVVSNPVELAVQVLTEVVDRQRVIGMGSEQDSLRFARAVATDLDVSRRHVRASVFGEHGAPHGAALADGGAADR